jgi:hypothetical protein
MSIMGRRILRLIGVSAVAIAVPQLASAMGPTSAAQKNSPQATSDKAVANCAASEAPARSRTFAQRAGAPVLIPQLR